MKKNLKALVVAAATLALTAVMLAGCSSGGDAQKSEGAGDGAADATTFTVGFDKAYPPYGFVGDDGEFAGIDLDMAKEVCDRNGWDLKLEAIDWDAKDALIDSGAITCIWNGFTIEGREADYAFTEPYMLNEQVIVVKKGSDVKSIDDLAGKTVMTQVDSAALDVLEGEDYADAVAKFAALDTIADYNTAFMQLESGAVDAVACDLSIADYNMAGNDKYVKLAEPLSSEHYGVGFKKGNTEMADKVTATLKEMYADGTIKQLCEKYAEYGVSFDNWVLK